MPAEDVTPPHKIIFRRGGNECQFCRVPMEPGTKKAGEPCPKRAARENRHAATVGLDTLREIGRKMHNRIDSERRKTTRKRTRKTS